MFQCQLMYSDAEFDVNSDFAIKHCLKLWFDWVLGGQSQNARLNLPTAAISHVGMSAKPVKNDYFPMSANVLRCKIRWKIWFCYQTLPGSMIWLRYGQSKSECAVNARWGRKGLSRATLCLRTLSRALTILLVRSSSFVHNIWLSHPTCVGAPNLVSRARKVQKVWPRKMEGWQRANLRRDPERPNIDLVFLHRAPPCAP